jgi:putative flippase GtrA
MSWAILLEGSSRIAGCSKSKRKAMNAAVLIPAYEPSETLLKLVEELLRSPFERIIIVNDGSQPEKKAIFDAIGKLSGKVKVLEHAINMGKGAALKTGFNYVLLKHPNISTIVTADADGQHQVADILKIAEAGVAKPNSLIMGARVFGTNVPFRSKFGNELTKKAFWFFSGLSLTDTQTGLRAVPLSLARRMLTVKANGYEFEMEMLINIRNWKIPMEERPISTIYENNNATSHFNPFKDSMSIYFVFIRYTSSSIFSFLVDYFLFLLAFWFIGNVYFSTYIARSVSLVVNYNLNRRTVFKSGKGIGFTFIGYLLLAILAALASAVLTNTFYQYLKLPLPVAKILSDSLLYFVNFAIQREFIFRNTLEVPE